MDVGARIRNDNSIVVEHVNPINPVTAERTLCGLIDSNRDDLDLNSWLALAHIIGGLNITDEMTNSTTRAKLLRLLARNIPPNR